ncbi:hypothetical protein ACFWCA_29515 [Streptomyces phaeochromogenes]|uniref:hypothetical protein n=1 Tax=Streptomyces phaeochromogenes TaxID=1923 RepID=UPI00367C2925
MRIEAARLKWSQMTCGCGRSADHIPDDFLASLQGPPSSRTGEGWADNHAYVQSNLMQPAVATTSMVMAALAGGAPLEHRRQLFIVLLNLVSGEQEDVAEECLRLVRSGSWLLYEEISSGRNIDSASYAFEILTLMEEESDRLKYFHEFIKENLSSDLR